jgi:5-formyltetrahydrofolate cyclo-ligase
MAVPPTSPKAELRKRLKNIRDGFVLTKQKPDFSELDASILTASCVAGYIAIGSEIDPRSLLQTVANTGAVVALPHVTSRAAPLRFLAWKPGTPLIPGPFGLLQPPADAAELSPDVILTPLLGFDLSLARIGYGAGHYDRAFAQFPQAHRIGLAWDCQQVDRIPVDEWDVPLHAVLTPTRWIA